MAKTLTLLIIIFFISSISYAQSFFLTNGTDPVVDPHSEQIYFIGFYRDSTGKPYLPIQRTDLKGENITNINIPGIPSFSNSSSKAVFTFMENDYDERFSEWPGGYYLIDFSVSDSAGLLIPIEHVQHYSFWRGLSKVLFSPDDSKFLIFPFNSLAYYFFEDSSIYDPGYTIYSNLMPEWSSDSTLLYIPTGGGVKIIEYNYKTDKFDTLINKSDPSYVIGDFSYNEELDLIMYSLVNYTIVHGIELILFQIPTRTERNIFHYFNNRFPDYGAHILEHIKWSPHNGKAAIISNAAIEPHDSRVLIYYYKSDSLCLYEDLGETDYSNRHELSWYDDNIIIYQQALGGIFGLDTSIPVKIRNQEIYQLTNFILRQNYPNPFNPTTTIEFDLPKTSNLTLKIFNILGKEVTKLVSDRLTAGSYTYEWDASNLASGMYLYRLEAGEFVKTKKMILMR